jgi:HJR/Mrr/RecB family endonuclease
MSELLCFATIPAAFFGWMFWLSFQAKVARCSHGKIGARQNRNLCDECKTAHDAEVERLRITSQAEQERATIERKAIEERNLVPCKHGTVGGFRNRKLCDQCNAEDETRRIAGYETFRIEKLKRQAEAIKYCAHGIAGAVQNYRLCEQCRDDRDPRSQLRRMHPATFESLVCELFSKQGYLVKQTSYGSDHGADGILTKDGEITIMQAKLFSPGNSVGEPVLRDVVGAMAKFEAKKGVVVTTGKFTRAARTWAKGMPVRLIEEDELIALLRKHLPGRYPDAL